MCSRWVHILACTSWGKASCARGISLPTNIMKRGTCNSILCQDCIIKIIIDFVEQCVLIPDQVKRDDPTYNRLLKKIHIHRRAFGNPKSWTITWWKNPSLTKIWTSSGRRPGVFLVKKLHMNLYPASTPLSPHIMPSHPKHINRGSGTKNVIFSNGPNLISECSNLL